MLENQDEQIGLNSDSELNTRSDLSQQESSINMLLKKIGFYSACGTVFLAVMYLLGYIPSMSFLGSVNSGSMPMTPITSVGFILLSGILLYMTYRRQSTRLRWSMSATAIAVLVTLFGGLKLTGSLLGIDLNFEYQFGTELDSLREITILQTSAFTGALFFLAGLALLALLIRPHMSSRKLFLEQLSSSFGIIILLISLLFCGAHIFDSSFANGQGSTAPIALTTALAFLTLAVSIITTAGENSVVLRLLRQPFREGRKPFSPRGRFTLLIGVMIGVAAISMFILLVILFRYEFNQRRIQLLATVQSQTRLMKQIAGHNIALSDALLDEDPLYNPYTATLTEFKTALRSIEEIGGTMEFTLAEQQGDSIIILLTRRTDNNNHPAPIAMDSDLAQPQRRALNGETGTMIGLDYQGHQVISAFDYINELHLGVVVKIDVEEIRAPFFRAVITGTTVTGIIILFGSLAFIWIGNPVIRRLENNNKYLQKEIDARKQIESVLQESEEQYRTLFQQASDGIIFLSSEGNLRAVNESFARMHGYSVEEMMGINLQDLDTPESGKHLPERMRRVLAGETIQFESEHFHKDGHIFSLWVSSGLVSVGENQYIQAFHRDITDRKQSELERSLLEAQLRQSQKLEAIGTMAAGISHSFNNILQAQLLHAEIVQRQLDVNSKLRINMQHIINSGNSARDLVGKIHTFSREGETRFVQIKMQHLVKESLDLLQSIIPRRIKIETSIDMDAAPVIGDYSHIQQIILNLCNNAVHAIGAEDGIMSVSFKEVSALENHDPNESGIQSRSHLELSVSDTGCGMSEATMEKIFDPFFTTKQVGQGTGLGLSIIHGIIEDMQGEIKVLSKEGQGSTFTVLFPVSLIHDIANNDLEETQKTQWTQSVLVIDPDPDIRSILNLILEGYGFRVYTESSAAEALESLRLEPGKYDIIISELSLPEISGLELSKNSLDLFPQIPIILMSGKFDGSTLNDCKNLGIRVLIKPWNENDLLNEIRALNLE